MTVIKTVSELLSDAFMITAHGIAIGIMNK